jgi:hypothetical protein
LDVPWALGGISVSVLIREKPVNTSISLKNERKVNAYLITIGELPQMERAIESEQFGKNLNDN